MEVPSGITRRKYLEEVLSGCTQRKYLDPAEVPDGSTRRSTRPKYPAEVPGSTRRKYPVEVPGTDTVYVVQARSRPDASN